MKMSNLLNPSLKNIRINESPTDSHGGEYEETENTLSANYCFLRRRFICRVYPKF